MNNVARKIVEIQQQNAASKIVVFCQHETMKDQLLTALPKDSCLDGFIDTTRGVEQFLATSTQNVLILSMDAPDTANWSLNIANHIMFVAPLVTKSILNENYNYKFLMAQFIGRDKQSENMCIWDFLWEPDTDVIEDEGKRGSGDQKKEARLLGCQSYRTAEKEDRSQSPDPNRRNVQDACMEMEIEWDSYGYAGEEEKGQSPDPKKRKIKEAGLYEMEMEWERCGNAEEEEKGQSPDPKKRKVEAGSQQMEIKEEVRSVSWDGPEYTEEKEKGLSPVPEEIKVQEARSVDWDGPQYTEEKKEGLPPDPEKRKVQEAGLEKMEIKEEATALGWDAFEYTEEERKLYL